MFPLPIGGMLLKGIVQCAVLLVVVVLPMRVEAVARQAGGLQRLGDKPLEALPGVETEYGVLRAADGSRLRTIVTRPANSTKKRLPAVLFVQWLSCDTIELDSASASGWQVMLRRLITESDMLWFRTEKAGVGDSEGPACDKLDYQTELDHHKAAFRALLARSDVDPNRVFIYGASMGSNFAPLIAAGEEVAGVVIWGGGATTWFERMLRFERNALELRPNADPTTWGPELHERAAYFARYLLNGEQPAEIAARDPELGKVWGRIVGTAPDGTHYGRPAAFHQQAQRQNWAGAWSRVKSPVLVMLGEHDWYESLDAAALIPQIVNNSAARSELRVFRGLDHHFTSFPTREAAFSGKGGSERAGPVVEAILAWFREVDRRSTAKPKSNTQLIPSANRGATTRSRRAILE